jgi:hypothetical protein
MGDPYRETAVMIIDGTPSAPIGAAVGISTLPGYSGQRVMGAFTAALESQATEVYVFLAADDDSASAHLVLARPSPITSLSAFDRDSPFGNSNLQHHEIG